MRRALSVVSIGALVVALWSGIAQAGTSHALGAAPISLSQELFRRAFGETDVAFATTDSLLGQYALTVAPAELAAQVPVALDASSFPDVRYAPEALIAPPTPGTATASYTAPVIASESTPVTLQPQETPALGYYRGAEPLPTIAPSSSRFDLPSVSGASSLSFSPVLNPTSGFTASMIGADDQAALPQLSSDVSVPVRLGHLRFHTHADAAQARSDALAFNDTAMGGGATIDARLGKWQKLGVDVSSHYEHMTVDQTVFNASSLDGTSTLDISNHLPVFVPAYADIAKHTFSAGLAVPVSRRMTASLQVDAQHLLGGYGAPGLSNLDANNTIYGARLTYQLKGTSAISLSAKQYRYQDNLIPLNAFTQTSANLNFTVKF